MIYIFLYAYIVFDLCVHLQGEWDFELILYNLIQVSIFCRFFCFLLVFSNIVYGGKTLEASLMRTWIGEKWKCHIGCMDKAVRKSSPMQSWTMATKMMEQKVEKTSWGWPSSSRGYLRQYMEYHIIILTNVFSQALSHLIFIGLFLIKLVLLNIIQWDLPNRDPYSIKFFLKSVMNKLKTISWTTPLEMLV